MFEALPRTNPPKSTLTYAFCIYVSAIAVSYFSSEKSRDTFKILQIFQYLLLRQNCSGVGSGQPEHARASLHYNFVSLSYAFACLVPRRIFCSFYFVKMLLFLSERISIIWGCITLHYYGNCFSDTIAMI